MFYAFCLFIYQGFKIISVIIAALFSLEQESAEDAEGKEGHCLDRAGGFLEGTDLDVGLVLVVVSLGSDGVCALLEGDVINDIVHLIAVIGIVLIDEESDLASYVLVLVDDVVHLVFRLVDKVLAVALTLVNAEHGGVALEVEGKRVLFAEVADVGAVLLEASPEDDGDAVDASGALTVDSEDDRRGAGDPLSIFKLVAHGRVLVAKFVGLHRSVVDEKLGLDGTALVSIVEVDSVLNLVKVRELSVRGIAVHVSGDVGVELDEVEYIQHPIVELM